MTSAFEIQIALLNFHWWSETRNIPRNESSYLRVQDRTDWRNRMPKISF
jgi:hypothetical protein